MATRMTRPRNTLIAALALVGGSLAPCAIAAAAVLPPGVDAAAPPAIRTAPGRVEFSVDGGAIDDQDNAGGAGDSGVALPDGGAVAVFAGQFGESDVVQIQADGALDASFGSGGIVQLGGELPHFNAGDILRQPDGRLVVLGTVQSSDPRAEPTSELVALNADGSPDASFGTAGVDVLPLQAASFALRPGGGFVVDGDTTQRLAANGTQIIQWVVAGLTSGGALDPSFGQSGMVTIAQNGAGGGLLTVLPDGDIVMLGSESINFAYYQSELGRLLPAGAPDPSFHGGTLETLPASPSELLAYPDGTVIVGVEHALIRYTAAGLPDQTFGSGGIVQTGPPGQFAQAGQLLPAAGDGALVIDQTGGEYAGGRYRAQLIGPTGAIDPSLGGPDGLAFSIPFGGGSSNLLSTIHPPPAASLGLDGNTFGGLAVQRPDGSYLFLGGVTVSQPTGEGTGNSIADFATAALTPSFKVDASFGGPATPPHASLAIIRQRASTARTRHGIRVTLKLSAPGLARVVVKAAGRVVAQNVLPVFGTGSTTLPVELTTFGAQWLKSHPRSRLTAALKARDLLASDASATATGSLR